MKKKMMTIHDEHIDGRLCAWFRVQRATKGRREMSPDQVELSSLTVTDYPVDISRGRQDRQEVPDPRDPRYVPTKYFHSVATNRLVSPIVKH